MAEEKKFGFLLVNKPIGPTSHDIIDKLRHITKIRKIGHAGTLDPFASGLLIVAVGREATRGISNFVKLDKVYDAELKFGMVSDTHDITGALTATHKLQSVTRVQIEKTLGGFVGKQKQVPPMYSAKKVKGKNIRDDIINGKHNSLYCR